MDSPEPDTLIWQSPYFATPFHFQTRDLQRIQFPVVVPVANEIGEYRLELDGGDVLFGSIIELQDPLAVVDIAGLGVVQFEMSSLRRIQRWKDPAGLLFHGPGHLNEWEADSGWHEEGHQLVCDKSTGVASPEMEATVTQGRTSQLSKLRRDISLPPRGRMELLVSWSQSPDFEIRLGSRDGTSAARFEFWEDSLVMARDLGSQRDAISVNVISPGPGSIQLQVYFDQERGHFHVYSSSGRLINELSVPAKTPGFHRDLGFFCHLSDLRIERLDVGAWNGKRPRDDENNQSRLLLSDGSLAYGRLAGFDVMTREFIVADQAEERRFPEAQVQDVTIPRLGTRALEMFQAESIGGVRISGKLLRIEGNTLWLKSNMFREAIAFPLDSLRSLSAVNSDRSAPERTRRLEYPLSRLEIHGLMLLGQLQDTESLDDTRLVWKPERSLTSSLLLPNVSGRIVYREQTLKRPAPPSLPVPVRPRSGPAEAEATVESTRRLSRPVLYLASGDTISCRRILMNEEGVTISSTNTDATFVPNDKVRGIDLVAGIPVKSSGTKLDRFLVLPRSQRNDPPVHLIQSVDGDLLRGRIIAMDQAEIQVALRNELQKLNRDGIARIFFLHKTGTEMEPVARPEDGMPVRAMLSGGHRLSFAATQVAGIFLSGQSRALGECRIDMQQLDEIRFGPGAMATVAVINPWDFRPAIEPNGADSDAQTSDLVGTLAPDFFLDRLDGGKLKLADTRGKIVVLDFWASWCAPCLQLMPQVDQVVREFADQNLELISVNLEEGPEQVRAALDRMKLSTTVVLDTTGRTAAQYRATTIPLTVVIGRDGRIARLFVGSGPRFGDQLREALKTLLEEQPKTERPM